MTGPVQPDQKGSSPLDWRILLEIAGAAAGIGAFTTLLGGALLWLRFDQVGLPADRAVSLLPRSMLLTVGAHHLLVAAVVGLLAVVAMFGLHPEKWPPRRKRLYAAIVGALVLAGAVWLRGGSKGLVIAAAVVGAVLGGWPGYNLGHWARRRWDKVGGYSPTVLVILVALVVVALLAKRLDVVPYGVLVGVATGAGLAAIIGTATSPSRGGCSRPTAWVVFVAFLFVGAAVALARTANHPKMEPIAVLLEKPKETLSGFYVGESDDRIFVATLPNADAAQVSADDIDTVVAVSRARVVRTLLRQPAGLDTDEPGREQVQTLLRELLAPTTAEQPAAPVTTTDPATTFAPLVNIHSKEKVPPTSVDFFLNHAWLAFAHSGCPPYGFARGTHASAEQLKQPGSIDTRILGEGGYKHHAGCGDKGPVFDSTRYTRPFSGARDKKLAEAEGFYIDLDNGFRRPKPSLTTAKESPQKLVRDVPVYYEEHNEQGATRITYWFFYPLSVPPATGGAPDLFVHEGDWERLSVLLAHEPDTDVWTPQSVRFNEHDGYEELPWSKVRKAADEKGSATHPIAYSAIGSHATYPKPGKHRQVLQSGDHRIIAVNDEAFGCPACPQWLTWQNLRDATVENWYGFGGAWGGVGRMSDTTGPLGPSDYKIRGYSPSPTNALGRPAAKSALRPPSGPASAAPGG